MEKNNRVHEEKEERMKVKDGEEQKCWKESTKSKKRE